MSHKNVDASVEALMRGCVTTKEVYKVGDCRASERREISFALANAEGESTASMVVAVQADRSGKAYVQFRDGSHVEFMLRQGLADTVAAKVDALDAKLSKDAASRREEARFDALRRRGEGVKERLEEEIEALGGFVGVLEFAKKLGVTTTTVGNWRRDGSILGLRRSERVYHYPLFQLYEGSLLEGLGDVVATLRAERVSDYAAMAFFLEPTAGLDGSTPLELLREGGNAERVAKHALRIYGG